MCGSLKLSNPASAPLSLYHAVVFTRRPFFGFKGSSGCQLVLKCLQSEKESNLWQYNYSFGDIFQEMERMAGRPTALKPLPRQNTI
jgi:hypothetical protein